MTRPIACGGSAGVDWEQRADVVVIGTGVAGLAAALAAHRRGSRTVVLSKATETATFYAQGGIAVVLPYTDDSVEAHVRDTVIAGAGLCDEDAVRSIVADGYGAVADLIADGARFDESAPGQWALTREGGHSVRRIMHAGGDATGAEVQRALDHAAATLDIRHNHVALEVLHDGAAVTGVLVGNADGIGVLHTSSVILATGGLGHLYSATTNPAGSTGDGIALALWAGVDVTDIEFIQFHPTMLFDRNGSGRRPLITEALRGEGAVLLDSRGESVMAGVHPMGDLAPRDVVAAAIEARLRASGDECVFLDARSIERFAQRFPTVTAACHEAGIDPTTTPIPVVPGAHYSCGGVSTDVHGRTRMPGLFAAGEVARTGMHGANRLASNSLLEGVVFGARVARHLREVGLQRGPHLDVPSWEEGQGREPDEGVVIAQNWKEIRTFMWNYVGIVRSDERLARARRRIDLLRDEIHAYYWDYRVTPDLLELRNLALVAELIIRSAQLRKESRGLHFTTDYPERSDARFGFDTVIEGA